MNTFQKTLTVSVILLVILNLTLLVVMWKKNSDPGRRFVKERPGQRMGQMVKNRLGLDPDQKKEFMRLHRAHQQKLKEMGRETRLLNRQLHRAIVNGDSLAESEVSEKMDSLHILLKNENFDHIRSITKLCRPEQQERLLKFLDEMPDRHGHLGKKKKFKKKD